MTALLILADHLRINGGSGLTDDTGVVIRGYAITSAVRPI
jgi:hypothetical protein